MGVSDDLAPSFTQKPALRQEDDGNKLIFECQLIASPKPEISWYRSDELLQEDTRTKFKWVPSYFTICEHRIEFFFATQMTWVLNWKDWSCTRCNFRRVFLKLSVIAVTVARNGKPMSAVFSFNTYFKSSNRINTIDRKKITKESGC